MSVTLLVCLMAVAESSVLNAGNEGLANDGWGQGGANDGWGQGGANDGWGQGGANPGYSGNWGYGDGGFYGGRYWLHINSKFPTEKTNIEHTGLKPFLGRSSPTWIQYPSQCLKDSS